MGLSSSEELGRAIGSIIRNVEGIKQDVFASDTDASLLLSPLDRVKVLGDVTITRKTLEPSALAFDRGLGNQMFDNISKNFDVGYDNDEDIVLFSQEF